MYILYIWRNDTFVVSDAAQTGNVNKVNYDGRFGRWSGMTGRDHTGSDMPGHGRTGSDVPGTGRTETDMLAAADQGLLVPAEDMAVQR